MKGWRRCAALLAIMLGIKNLEISLEDVPDVFKAPIEVVGWKRFFANHMGNEFKP